MKKEKAELIARTVEALSKCVVRRERAIFWDKGEQAATWQENVSEANAVLVQLLMAQDEK